MSFRSFSLVAACFTAGASASFADTDVMFHGMANFQPLTPAVATAAGLVPFVPFLFEFTIAPDADGQKAAGYGAPLLALDFPTVRANVAIAGQKMAPTGLDQFSVQIVDSGVPGGPDLLKLIAYPSQIPGTRFPNLDRFELSLMLDPGFSVDGALPADWRAAGALWSYTPQPITVSITDAGGSEASTQIIYNYGFDS